MLELGYGLRKIQIVPPPNLLDVLRARPLPAITELRQAVGDALRNPTGSAPLARLARRARRVVVVFPDKTRSLPREELLEALLEELGLGALGKIVLLVATGKHPPHGVEELGLETHLLRKLRVVFHDSRDPGALRRVGETSQGTPVLLNKIYLDADLRLAVGAIRPHYFAGYSGGAKLVFPGVAGEEGIFINHHLKGLPGSRLGVVDGNPCRADMEEAVSLAKLDFILNVISGEGGEVCGVVAGHPIAAHRQGVALARLVAEVPARGAVDCVIVSEGAPTTANLYQASKLIAPAARIVRPGGVIILVASCYEGLGPVEIINEGIYRQGLVPILPRKHTIFLISSLTRHQVSASYCLYSQDIRKAIERTTYILGRAPEVSVIPYGSSVTPILNASPPWM